MLRLLLIFALCLNSVTGVLGQGFLKPIPTNSYPLPSLKSAYVMGQHIKDDGIRVAFEAYFGNPGRLKYFFGTYTAQGDLVQWHEIPDTIGKTEKKFYFFDSVYVRDYEISPDSTIVQAFDYSGSELWHLYISDYLDQYSAQVENPSEIFFLGFSGFYEYLNPMNGSSSPVWNADSLHLAMQNQLILDSILRIDRLAEVDTGVYYLATYVNAGVQGNRIVFLDHSCGCWLSKANLSNDLKLVVRNGAPLLFSQSGVQLVGDSVRSDLVILNPDLDTLWSKSLMEPAFMKKDSSFIVQQYVIDHSSDGCFLLENPRSRRSKESFIPDQYQVGIHYWVMDSNFIDILEVTVWPKDTIGRVIDEMYSTNQLLVGGNKFNVDFVESSLTVCLNIAQLGLGEPRPMIMKTGASGLSFLNTSKKDFDQQFSFGVFPNPANEVLRIAGDLALYDYYQVTNLSGEIVLQGSINESGFIEVRGLQNGVYFLTVIGELQEKYVLRFIVFR